MSNCLHWLSPNTCFCIWKNHCVKSVQIRSVFLFLFQKKTPYLDTFQAVSFIGFIIIKLINSRHSVKIEFLWNAYNFSSKCAFLLGISFGVLAADFLSFCCHFPHFFSLLNLCLVIYVLFLPPDLLFEVFWKYILFSILVSRFWINIIRITLFRVWLLKVWNNCYTYRANVYVYDILAANTSINLFQ